MAEREFWYRPTSRRSLLKNVGLGAATATAAAIPGLIDDVNDRIESRDDLAKITPIYGEHITGTNSYEKNKDFTQILDDTGVFGESQMWPGAVHAEARRLQPALLAIDSLSYSPLQKESETGDYKDLWRLSPGNPFRINPRGLRIIAADLPHEILRGFEEHPDFYLQQRLTPEVATALMGIKMHYETTTGFKIGDDTNMLVHPEDIERFEKHKLIETAVSNIGIGIGPLMYLAAESAVRKKPVTRRKFIGMGSLSILGFGNTARIHGDFISGDGNELYKLQYAPLSTAGMIAESHDKGLPYIELRNALISIKLEDAEKELGLGTVKKAAVMGSGHQFGKDVWYSPQQSRAVVKKMLDETFGIIKEFEGHGVNREKVADAIADIYGGVRVFRMGQEPSYPTIDAVKANAPVEASFISPTIRLLVHESAGNAEYAAAIR